jgi:hypothetical protein
MTGDGSLTTPNATQEYLRELHDAYADKLNRVLEEGRDDLVPALVDAYEDEALEAITMSEPPTGSAGVSR